MGKLAIVFPGQGSQSAGMGMDLKENGGRAGAVFAEADEALGMPLSKLIFNGPQEELTRTYNAQPALLTAGYAFYLALSEAGIRPDYTAGHSLGEYTALAAAGTISFADAVQTVRKRGIYMEEAVPDGRGGMAAVLGLDQQYLAEAAAEVSAAGEPVGLANINCPGQIVISGAAEAVRKAGELAREKGAKRVIPLDVSGPFHSVLMEPAAGRLAETLAAVPFREPEFPVISNVTAQPVTDPESMKKLLIEQLYSPVQWEQSIRFLLEEGVDTFIEAGPGKVLSGLIKKIDRRTTVHSVHNVESLHKTIEALKEEA